MREERNSDSDSDTLKEVSSGFILKNRVFLWDFGKLGLIFADFQGKNVQLHLKKTRFVDGRAPCAGLIRFDEMMTELPTG